MGWPFFADLWRRRKNREIHLFAKWPFLRLFARFFGHPSRKPFFLDSGLLSCGNAAVEVDTRETLQNKGFWSHFACVHLFDPFWRFEKASFCGPVLRIIFSVCYYFVRFDVRIFVEMRGVRGGAVFFRGFWVPVKMALPLRCGGFFRVFRVFFDPVFENLKWSSSHPPLFLWVFFLFCSHSSWDWGQRRIAHMFLAVGLQPFLSFGGFWGLLRKTLFFPLKKGYLGSFLSVSFLCLPFVRPWLLSLLFVNLSLSLYLSISLSLSLSFFFLVFFFFLVVLFLFLPSLFFWLFFLVLLLRFCFMRRTTSEYYIWKFAFHHLFCLFFCFVFQICSYLCFFII